FDVACQRRGKAAHANRESRERLAPDNDRGAKRLVEIRQRRGWIASQEVREPEETGNVRQLVFLSGLQDGRPECEQRSLRLVAPSEKQIDCACQFTRTSADSG